MANNVNVVSAILTPEQRTLVLNRFTPFFEDVFAFHMTWAYRVTEEFTFPRHPIVLVLDGYHLNECTDAATGYVASEAANLWTERVRPDGTIVHVTLSTRPGTPPRDAGLIRPQLIKRVEPLRLSITLVRRHATTLRPERREVDA